MAILASKVVSALILSPRMRAFSRSMKALRRKLSGQRPEVLYFHQPDDPYSQLTAQVLTELQARYDIDLQVKLVNEPEDDAAPERLALQAHSRRDAALIATFHNLSFTDAGQQPSEASLKLARRSLAASSNLPKAAAEIGEAFWSDDTDKLDRTAMVSDDQTERVFREGTRLRGQLGHYLGATFFFEGEWYWGLDRLPYLEERLAEAGLRLSGCRQITAFQTRPEFMGSPSNGKRLTVEFYPSARSPYSAIAMKETLDLPNHYPVNVHVRPVLPMVMRNLPVPPKKRFYILRDTKREADRIGAPFGKIADPVGEPVRRVYSLFSWAEEQGKGGALLQAFVDMAWAEGIETGSDNGMKQVCARAGLDREVASTIIDNKDWEGWAEDNRLQMLKSDLWGVPSFRLIDENGTELYAGWGRDRIWLLAHEIQKALAS
ncbi:MAG: DsbA family protein [Alphaproteobacteria bacterium]|nr:DsbA family protein [Alphaproteobacteria bacterium]